MLNILIPIISSRHGSPKARHLGMVSGVTLKRVSNVIKFKSSTLFVFIVYVNLSEEYLSKLQNAYLIVVNEKLKPL